MADRASRRAASQGSGQTTATPRGGRVVHAPRPIGRRRRGGRTLLIAALVGMAVALGALAYVVFGSNTGTASIAAQHFCDALVRHDYAAAYTQLAPALRQQGSAQQFAASQQDLDRISGAAVSCQFSAPQVHGDHATFTLTLVRSGTVSGALDLILIDGSWQVDAYDANVI